MAAEPGFVLPAPLALACHDAGAANHVLAWLAAGDLQAGPGRVALAGPAGHAWAARFGSPAPQVTLEAALDGAAAVLSGTGWASDFEHEARVLARAAGLRSIAVVDHWVNYAARFERDGSQVLPDEIWVTDADALAIAQRCFPGLPVRQQPNRYLDEQLRGIAPMAAAGDDVLVVLEPARSDWGRGTPGEFQALDYLVARHAALGLPAGSTLRLRPHPSDPPGKYDAWLARPRAVPARLDDAPTLAAAISRCRWVAGCESAALVVALAAGRHVVCTLPPWAPAGRLPHAGLIHLRQLPESS